MGEKADSGSEAKLSEPSNLPPSLGRETKRGGVPTLCTGEGEARRRGSPYRPRSGQREPQVLSLPLHHCLLWTNPGREQPMPQNGKCRRRSEGKQAQNRPVLQNDPPGHTLRLPELSRSPQGAALKTSVLMNEADSC